jgi:hypothetical protein
MPRYQDALPALEDKARATGVNAIIIDSYQPVKSGMISTGSSVQARAVRLERPERLPPAATAPPVLLRNRPLPTPQEAIQQPFRAFPSWFLRIECDHRAR